MWQNQSDDEKSSKGGGCESFIKSMLQTYESDPMDATLRSVSQPLFFVCV